MQIFVFAAKILPDFRKTIAGKTEMGSATVPVAVFGVLAENTSSASPPFAPLR